MTTSPSTSIHTQQLLQDVQQLLLKGESPAATRLLQTHLHCLSEEEQVGLHLELARFHNQHHQYPDALTHLYQGLQIPAGKPAQRHLLHLTLGHVHLSLNDYPASLDQHTLALLVAEGHLTLREQADAQVGLSLVLNATQRHREAFELCRRIQTTAERLCDLGMQINATAGSGVAALGMGEPEHARFFLQEALKLLEVQPTPFIQIAVLSHLGRTHQHLGDVNAALDAHQQALSLASRTQNPKGAAQQHHQLGILCWQQGNRPEAELHLAEALQLAERHGWKRLKANVHLTLSEVLEDADPRTALQHHRTYHQMDRELLGEQTEKHLQTVTLKMELEWAQQETRQIHGQKRQLEDLHRTLQDAHAQQAELTRQLHHQARHDSLTGLPNRQHFLDTLQDTLLQASPAGRQAVLFVDLDSFKAINDTYGHEAGDVVLRTVADRLQCPLPVKHFVARMGGDEFTVILHDLPDWEEAVVQAEHLRMRIHEPISLDGLRVRMSASVGVVVVDHPDLEAGLWLRQADQAMYQAKRQGKNQITVLKD